MVCSKSLALIVSYVEMYKRKSLKMLKLASNYIKNPTSLRRLLFAAYHLPMDLPDYWKAIAAFGKDSSITK